MTQVLLKSLLLVFSFNALSSSSAVEIDNTPTLNEKIVENLVGLYEGIDELGRGIVLSVLKNESASMLEIYEAHDGRAKIILQMPLLMQDLKAMPVTLYEQRDGEQVIINEVSDHSILDPNRFSRLKISTTGVNRVVENIEFTIIENKLMLKIEKSFYQQRIPMIGPWDEKEVLGNRELVRSFKKTSSRSLTLTEINELLVKKLEIKAQEQIDAPEEVKRGEVIEWKTPEKSSFNFMPEGHSAKIISYEKFKQYRIEKACKKVLGE